MGYLNENAPSEEMSVVFLPARAAAVAMAQSSLSSFAALAMLVRLALDISEISGEDILLVACCASAFAIFVVASLTLAYARFLPPPFSRVWQLVSPVISFLIVMWLAGLGLSIALFVDVLYPFMSCDDVTCKPHDRDIAIQTLSVLVVALVSCFALAMLVSFDLRTTRHHANVIIYRSELHLRQRLRKQKQALARQAQTVPLHAGPAWSSDEELGLADAVPSRSASRDAMIHAYVARAQRPLSAVDPFLDTYERRTYPPSFASREGQQKGGPFSAQYSEGKEEPRRRHHYRRKSDGTSTTESRLSARTSDSSLSGSSTSTNSEEERQRKKRRERKKARHRHSHESEDDRRRPEKRRSAEKRIVRANVVQMVDAAMAPAE
ncbi:hypothetical protein Rt10032_c01g0477 [Rhodotorula toruloides]|uniref:Uncharacterized protein n=1 Tax=Rhodotorula toruloides TaxID=5286 RepID=A0A511K801_RHOTO|nr:hypothetical protein Rt10032_c01g0477 [Rhodotorula toruloides]